MGSIVGITTAKIDGMYELDVKNATWDDRRPLNQEATAGGIKNATGLEFGSGSFDEVFSKVGATNWQAKKQFTIDIYDQETRKIVVASFARCDWESIGGSSDVAGAKTDRKVTWKSEEVVKV